jgi:hypothetical protein
MAKITTTLEKVKRGMERMFIPNIIITWDAIFKMYLIKAHIHTSEERYRLNYNVESTVPCDTFDDIIDMSGEAWLKMYKSGIKTKQGRVIPASYLDAALASMGTCGLVYQIESQPEQNESG